MLRDPSELQRDIARALPAGIRVLLEAALHDPLECGRRHWNKLADLARLGRQHCGHHVRRRLAIERALAGNQFVEHAAESKDVRARVCLASFDLLGGHVLRSAEYGVRARERRDGGIVAWRRTACGLKLREAEIQQLDARLRSQN